MKAADSQDLRAELDRCYSFGADDKYSDSSEDDSTPS